jgi:hypothetical protein
MHGVTTKIMHQSLNIHPIMIKVKIFPRSWLSLNAPQSTHSEKPKTAVLVSSIGAQKTSNKNKLWPTTFIDKHYDILQAVHRCYHLGGRRCVL